VTLAAEWLSAGFLQLYPWTVAEERELGQLASELRRYPQIPELEAPDLKCLAAAKASGLVLLTENLGVRRVVEFHPRYREVEVWTSLTALERSIYEGLQQVRGLDDYVSKVSKYEEETGHRFSRRSLEESYRRVEAWLRGR